MPIGRYKAKDGWVVDASVGYVAATTNNLSVFINGNTVSVS